MFYNIVPLKVKNKNFKGISHSTIMDQINKHFEELKIQSYEKYNKDDEKHLAGKINSVIRPLDVVLVKPHSSEILLHFGTPLFLSGTNCSDCKSEYILLGYIDDIFGSVKEPMYSVSIKCDSSNALNINASVYYFPSNPNTVHISVEYTTNETVNKKMYNIRMLKY